MAIIRRRQKRRARPSFFAQPIRANFLLGGYNVSYVFAQNNGAHCAKVALFLNVQGFLRIILDYKLMVFRYDGRIIFIISYIVPYPETRRCTKHATSLDMEFVKCCGSY